MDHIELPAIADRARIVGAKQAAALYGVSLPHFRRLYRAGKVPAPIKIGERKLGWQIGAALDDIAARQQSASPRDA